jgi:hypothetical protein
MMRTDLTHVVVGDTLVVLDPNRPSVKREVTKVGRKWLTVNGSQYSRIDGKLNSGWAGSVTTVEAYEFHRLRSELLERIMPHFVRPGTDKLSTEQLQAIAEILRT